MKKAFLIIVCIAFIQQATAQTNPKPGFIITNANDTVYGTNDKYATVRLPYGNGKTWNMYVAQRGQEGEGCTRQPDPNIVERQRSPDDYHGE